jgi:thymidylate kinase
MTAFWTLLGPDFAGKSTVLRRLSRDHGWRVVSHDDEFLGDRPLVSLLRRCWVDEALRYAGTRYTAELVLSALHPVILHQRDELARAGTAGTAPLIVDSFFYKVRAACTLLGVTDDGVFSRWCAMQPPRGIIYLDVPPEVTWQRAGERRTVSAFEHYGPQPTRQAFVDFQTDLRALMLEQVRDLPVTMVDGTAPPDTVLAKIRSAVGPA